MTAKVNGKTFDVNWMCVLDGALMCAYNDERKMSLIVKDWEGAEVIERMSETEGDEVYAGYTRIKHVVIEKNNVQIALLKEDE